MNTVSLALRDSPLVADETKRIIVAAAREVGYVRNDVAGSLRSGRTHTIAVIFGDIGNMLFATKIAELEKALRQHNYQVMILNTGENAEGEYKAVVTAISRKVDGVILCPCQEDREAIDLMRKRNVPYVLIGRCFQGVDDDAVVWDDYRGGYIAGKHLVERGCRKPLMLNVPLRISSAKERQDGFQDAMREAGLTPEVRQVSPLNVDLGKDLDAIFAGSPDIDGVFAFSDLIAFSAAQWCQERGIRIPEDLLMIGFDDILSHVHIPFALSSICADKDLEAQTVVNHLLAHIRQQAGEGSGGTVRIDVELVARRSTDNRDRT